jgi:hypothetical protein
MYAPTNTLMTKALFSIARPWGMFAQDGAGARQSSNHTRSGNAPLPGGRPARRSWIHVLHGHKRPPCMTHDLDWDARVQRDGECMKPPIRVTCCEGQVRRDGRVGDVTDQLPKIVSWTAAAPSTRQSKWPAKGIAEGVSMHRTKFGNAMSLSLSLFLFLFLFLFLRPV